MRPPDENQPGFTRPNFMSASRRASGEDNILARLERDGKRGAAAKSWKSAKAAWCGLAGAAVFGLVGVLAMLTRENVALNKKPIVVDAKPSAFEVDPGLLSRGGFAPLPPGNAPDKIAAAISDVRPERPWKDDPPAKAPPMVMLKPAAPAPAKPVVVAARATPPKPAAKSPAAKPAAPVARVAMAAQLKTFVMPPPLRPATPPPPRTVAAIAPARAKKPAPAAVAKAEPIDSDIALLSAIIMHASRHAGERAQIEAAQCGGKKCPPSDPPMSMKITD